MPDPYELDARYYDTIHADAPDDDIGLWLSFAGRTRGAVLEVGAGTGRIALALARAGHRVTALDPSEAMLARLREAAANARLSVETLLGTATQVALAPEAFGLVLVPADVFLYCEDAEEQIATLEALAAAMEFNATLILDLPGPSSGLDPSLNGQALLAFAGEGPDAEQLEAWHIREDDLAAQTRTLTVRYETVDADGLVRRTSSTHALLYVYPSEARHLLALAGLEAVDVYGDYELGPLTSESERMIVIARRTRG